MCGHTPHSYSVTPLSTNPNNDSLHFIFFWVAYLKMRSPFPPPVKTPYWVCSFVTSTAPMALAPSVSIGTRACEVSCYSSKPQLGQTALNPCQAGIRPVSGPRDVAHESVCSVGPKHTLAPKALQEKFMTSFLSFFLPLPLSRRRHQQTENKCSHI